MQIRNQLSEEVQAEVCESIRAEVESTTTKAIRDRCVEDLTTSLSEQLGIDMVAEVRLQVEQKVTQDLRAELTPFDSYASVVKAIELWREALIHTAKAHQDPMDRMTNDPRHPGEDPALCQQTQDYINYQAIGVMRSHANKDYSERV